MKIIIVGKGPGWERAPVEGETWGVNDLLLRRPVKLTFQIHNIDKLPHKDFLNVEAQVKEINKLGIPVIIRKKHKLFPTGIIFPYDKMPVQYFSNSIAYMIAYAVYKGATEIEMYGVALLLKEEYADQRPCIEFWIGYALGKGVKVTVHDPTTIRCFNSLQELYE